MEETVTYPIKMDRGKWDEWTKTIPRNKTINEALVELVLADLETSLEEKERCLV